MQLLPRIACALVLATALVLCALPGRAGPPPFDPHLGPLQATPSTLDRLALGGNGDGQTWYLGGGGGPAGTAPTPQFSLRAIGKPDGVPCGFAIKAHNEETGLDITSPSYAITRPSAGAPASAPLSMGMQMMVPAFPGTVDATPGHYTFTVTGAPAPAMGDSPTPFPACRGSAKVDASLDDHVIGHKLPAIIPMAFGAPVSNGWFILGTNSAAYVSLNVTMPCAATLIIRDRERKIEKYLPYALRGDWAVDFISAYQSLGGKIEEGTYDLTLVATPRDNGYSWANAKVAPLPCMGSSTISMRVVTGSVIRPGWNYQWGQWPGSGGSLPTPFLAMSFTVAGRDACALTVALIPTNSNTPWPGPATVFVYKGGPSAAGTVLTNEVQNMTVGPYRVVISGTQNVPGTQPCKGTIDAQNVIFNAQTGTFP